LNLASWRSPIVSNASPTAHNAKPITSSVTNATGWVPTWPTWTGKDTTHCMASVSARLANHSEEGSKDHQGVDPEHFH